MFVLKGKTGQSTLEYAIIFVAILVAFLFMQTYVKQAVQGRLRSSADDIGEGFSPGGIVNYTAVRNTLTREVTDSTEDSLYFERDRTIRTGYEETPTANDEPWTYPAP